MFKNVRKIVKSKMFNEMQILLINLVSDNLFLKKFIILTCTV